MKVVQAAVFLSVVALFAFDKNAPDISGFAIVLIAAFFAFASTMLPWLIYRAVADTWHRFRSPKPEPSQAGRIDSVVLENPLDRTTRLRLTSDLRPRIDK